MDVSSDRGRGDRSDSAKFRAAQARDARALSAWCEWLRALATDAEAALATAIAYRELDEAGRDTWLDLLEQDAHALNVPKIAVYAPLLAVEADPVRRTRIASAMGEADPNHLSLAQPTGLRGRSKNGLCVAAVVAPLYLDFGRVLACAYRPDRGIEWAKHDPIVELSRAPRSGLELSGVVLESTPLCLLVDELALALLADRRAGREPPEALKVFSDLFDLRPSYFGPDLLGADAMDFDASLERSDS